MIPKIIHFIWVGETIPQYCLNSINKFKKSNPLFEVNLLHTTIDEIQTSTQIDIQETRDSIFETINGKQNRWSIYINKYIKYNLTFISIFTDLLRFVLLDRYGGIYLDCDTWPVKPFDEELLNRDSFFVTRMENYFYRDSFFMGFKRGFLGNKFINTTYINFNGSQFDIKQSENKFTDKIRVKLCNNIFNYSVPSLIDSKLYSIDKNKFLSGRLNKFEHYLNQSNLIEQRSFIENYYIDHYFIKSWE